LPLSEALGSPIVGIDLSANMLAIARSRLGNVVAVADAEQLPLASSSVDTIVEVWVLQLVGSVGALMAEAARVLRPGGLMAAILAVPIHRPDDIDALVSQMYQRLRPLETRKDRPDAVIAHAAAAGFTVLSEGFTTPQEWQLAPVAEAERIEGRTTALLLDLDQATFESVALTTAASLRSLPEPEVPRERASWHPLLVFELTDR
jgi:SAM-dependent methyltransferase